jgi:hypothetical protein
VPGPIGSGRIRPKLRTVLADSGYASEENFARAGQDELRLLAPLANDPGRPGGRPAKRARHLDQYPATTRAIRRMRRPRGPEDCKLRARTVEPVFGQLRTCQKLTVMFRRGLAACESEWLLACTARNLRKLHRHRAGDDGQRAGSRWPGPYRSPEIATSHPCRIPGSPIWPLHEGFVRQADPCTLV